MLVGVKLRKTFLLGERMMEKRRGCANLAFLLRDNGL